MIAKYDLQNMSDAMFINNINVFEKNKGKDGMLIFINSILRKVYFVYIWNYGINQNYRGGGHMDGHCMTP